MKRIIKMGPLNVAQPFILSNCSNVIHFDEQNGELFAWVIQDLESSRDSTLSYLIVGTGQDWESSYVHEKSVVTKDGFVWHLLRERSFLTDGVAIF